MKANNAELRQMINHILDKRHAQLPAIAQKRQELHLLLDSLEGLSEPEAELCRMQIRKALAECDKAEQYFKRDKLHISVIGKERSGKSCLLQSFSPLPDNVIFHIPTIDYDSLYGKSGKITLTDSDGPGAPEVTDAIIFLLLPNSPSGGYVDHTTLQIYRTLLDSCQVKDLSKQLYWLINEAPHRITRAACECCVKTLDSSKMHKAMTAIVNAGDRDQVREEFFIPMLNTLMENLYDIDSLYADGLTNALEAVCKACEGIPSAQLSTNLSYRFS